MTAPLGKVRASADHMWLRVIPIMLGVILLTNPRVAAADVAGDGATEGSALIDASSGGDRAAGPDASSEDTAPASGSSSGPTFVTACDGALCDTTTGSQCGVAAGRASRAQENLGSLMAMAGAAALLGARRNGLRASRPSRLRNMG
jgi:hypothetical protein